MSVKASLIFFQEQLRERVTALEGTLQSVTDENTKAVDELQSFFDFFFQEQLRERVTALEGTLQSVNDENTKAVDELQSFFDFFFRNN